MIKAPDQTDSTAATINYYGTRQVERTVMVGETLSGSAVQQQAATTTETHDSFGRLIKVDESDSVSSTSYLHDAADRLTSVSMTDTLAGVTQPSRIFSYDGRGFLASETHPENGTTFYKSYDARGHVGRKLAGTSYSQFDLKYEYDAAERLVHVYQLLNRIDPPNPPADSTQLVKEFNFAAVNDGANYKLGKLETATRRNYSPAGTADVKETYSYADSAGRLTNKTIEVTNVQTGLQLQKYTQDYEYNNLGLYSKITYPTCFDTSRCANPSSMILNLSPTYQNGLLTSVPNFATAITYDLNGMVTEIDHPGAVNDIVTADPSHMARPSRIQFNSYDQCSSPQITLPGSKQVTPPASPGLQVTVVGTPTPPLTYQWLFNGTLIAGETGSSCCSAAASSGTYTARLINSCGKGEASTTVTVCGSPTVTISPQSATYSGTPVTLTATASGCGTSFTYQWFIGDAPDTSTPTGTSSATFTTPQLQATTHYWVRVTDSFGGTGNSNTVIVTLSLCTPQITQQPSNQTVNFNDPVANVHVVVSGCTGRIFDWYRGAVGDTSRPFFGNRGNATLDTFTGFESMSVWVRIGGQFLNSVDSTSAVITVIRPVPTAVNAFVTPNTNNQQITVSWASVPFTNQYLIRRCSSAGCVGFTAPGTATSYQDSVGLSSNTTYVYSVASADSFGTTSAYSAPNLATTMSFAPLQANVTTIAFSHFDQIRTAINAIRAAHGDGALTWRQILDLSNYTSVPVPASNERIYTAHVLALRNAMNAALTNLQVPAPAYTDSLALPTLIKALHITELQQRAQ